MSDANNESHDYGIGNRILGNDPEWRKAFIDRAVSLVLRDRNHPCILLWSLGNESAGGDNPKAMADTVKATRRIPVLRNKGINLYSKNATTAMSNISVHCIPAHCWKISLSVSISFRTSFPRD
jgi:beta-galactosidase/beta-glucuronidase